MAIIKAEGVSIRYITGDFKDIGLKEFVVRRLQGNYKVKEFWADKNVTFSLERGDMLGIIGANGAGKSTLLKAVSGIMVPTEGHMEINGSVAALLELASGFDGELTVQENTYLRGAMLGYTRKFMNEKYDEIIDFAELKDFQDRPFKQLSSGMKSRLAFSIACLVSPDILNPGRGAQCGRRCLPQKEWPEDEGDPEKRCHRHSGLPLHRAGAGTVQQDSVAGPRQADCLHRRGGTLLQCLRGVPGQPQAAEKPCGCGKDEPGVAGASGRRAGKSPNAPRLRSWKPSWKRAAARLPSRQRRISCAKYRPEDLQPQVRA